MRVIRTRQVVKTIKTYERDLSHGMAATLVIYANAALRSGRREWIHYTKGFSLPSALKAAKSREVPKLRWWGLMEDGQRGFYRITENGFLFATNRSMVLPKYVYEEGSQVLGFSDGRAVPPDFGVEGMTHFPYASTTILQALDTHFDYDELMNSFAFVRT